MSRYKKGEWSTQEIKILKKNYHKFGRKIDKWKGLLNRTAMAIYNKANQLKLKVDAQHVYRNQLSPKEIKILKKKYPTHGTKIKELAHINRNTLKSKATWLGLNKKRIDLWTKKDVKNLKDLIYYKNKIAKLKGYLKKFTKDAIRYKTKKIKFRKKH